MTPRHVSHSFAPPCYLGATIRDFGELGLESKSPQVFELAGLIWLRG